jgi:hypothetical protein
MATWLGSGRLEKTFETNRRRKAERRWQLQVDLVLDGWIWYLAATPFIDASATGKGSPNSLSLVPNYFKDPCSAVRYMACGQVGQPWYVHRYLARKELDG